MRKKTKKMRGSHTHGYGSKKKHRGAGSKGGKGLAGSSGHKKLFAMEKFPERFGKRGFRRRRKGRRTINVGELEGKKIDLDKAGYDKLLGKGSVSKPFRIKVKKLSKKAKEKIEKAGGRIGLP